MTVMQPTVAAGTDPQVQEYGTPAKWFHWITVPLLLTALPVGIVIKYIPAPEPDLLAQTPAAQQFAEAANQTKMAFYAVHESAGVTIFLVVLARLLWRLTHPAPPMSERIPAPLRRVANTVHHSLYGLLLLQPMLGFLATNAWGFPLRGDTAYLGFINLPKFMEADPDLAGPVQLVHTYVGWTILLLIVLHVLGVIWHQAIRRDNTLLRMV
jgi:cytochrome b561